jgi:hypothetical protein
MIICFQNVQLDAPLQQSGYCIILTELILPRNGIAKKSALKDVQLAKGKRSFRRQPFYEKALLKEKVDGLVGLKISVTRPLKYPQLQLFMRQLLAVGIESSVDLLPFTSSGLSELFNDVLDEAGEQLGDRIADEDPVFIAAGGIDLDTATLASGPVSIDLKLEKSIRFADLPPGPKARDQRKRQSELYRKGRKVGHVTLDLQLD